MKAWPIAVVATLVFTASAVGQTPDPYYGDKYKLKRVPARLQNEANRTCRWINERYLSSSIVCPTIYSSTKLGGVDGIAIPSGTVVMYNRTVVAGLPGGATDGVWLTIAVHEFFHRVTYLNSDWTLGTWTEGDRWIEEGVVQAVTNDVMPIMIRKVFNNNVTAQADAYVHTQRERCPRVECTRRGSVVAVSAGATDPATAPLVRSAHTPSMALAVRRYGPLVDLQVEAC